MTSSGENEGAWPVDREEYSLRTIVASAASIAPSELRSPRPGLFILAEAETGSEHSETTVGSGVDEPAAKAGIADGVSAAAHIAADKADAAILIDFINSPSNFPYSR